MKVAIDLTALRPRPSGVDRYLVQIVHHLARIDRDTRYTILLNYEDRHVFRGALPANFRTLLLCLRPRTARLLFQQFLLPVAAASMGVDVVHSPAFLAPRWRGTQRHLVTAHDMTFFSMRHVHSPLHQNGVFRWAVRESLLRAHLIAVPSHWARQDLLAVLPEVPPARVRVTPYGIDASFHPASPAEVRRHVRRLGLPDPYILYVGNIEPRKNLPVLLASYGRLAETGAVSEHLVIAGHRHWGAAEILQTCDRPPFRGRVHVTGFIQPADLPWVYRGARLFVYPSFAEGFGFPPLEAMSAGVPVVTTATGSLPEVAGPGADLVPVGDADALAAGLARVLSDDEHRRDLVARGHEVAARHSWDTTAERFAALLRRVAGAT
jgi:glycosyltransferase involved in cell wall biosynthesis